MKITFVNVGYGEAVLIQVPDKCCRDGIFTMLIDGGGGDEAEFSDSASGRIPCIDYLKQSGIGHIDVMLNTHIHEDHTSGLLQVAESLPPAEFRQPLPASVYTKLPWLDPSVAETVTGAKYIQSINDFSRICTICSGNVKQVKAEDPEDTPAEGLRIRVLTPDEKKIEQLAKLMRCIAEAADDRAKLQEACSQADGLMNNFSLILMLEYAGRRILLPGDTNSAGFAGLSDLKADIYKVGHHGQRDGVSRELFQKIRPGYVVCCASSDRRYNSADPETLTMMRQEGAEILFSDCPPVPEGIRKAPPHSALTFVIKTDGSIEEKYE